MPLEEQCDTVAAMPVQHDGENLDASEAELWFASKKLPLESKLSQHVGRNEKTKVNVQPGMLCMQHSVRSIQECSSHSGHLKGLLNVTQ